MDLDVTEGYKWKLSCEMVALQSNSDLDYCTSYALEWLLKLYSVISEVVEKLVISAIQVEVPMVSDGNPGHPKFNIIISPLRTLLEYGFAVPNITGILDIFVSSVRGQNNDNLSSVCSWNVH